MVFFSQKGRVQGWHSCVALNANLEELFSDFDYVIELVEWAMPDLNREGAEDGWKGFVYALKAIYDYEGALEKVNGLKDFDDGNSLTNLLWWIHSRGNGDDE